MLRFSRAAFASLLGLITIVVAAPAGHALDYYVSNTGSDSNPGTQALPFATLQRAADVVNPGDNVFVADGTYEGVHITRDGTAAAPITFKALGSSAVVDRKNRFNDHNINVEGGDYIIIDGFISEDAPRVGIRAVLATGVIFRNNIVRRAGLSGILTGWAPKVQIINNVCGNTIQQHGIYVSNSDTPNDDVVIRGNRCFGNNNNGIQINGDCWVGGDGVIHNAIIEDNVVHDNNWKGMSLISMQDSFVRNNVIFNNGISAGAGGIHLTDQVGPSCDLGSNNNVVCNNTIIEPRIAGIRVTDSSIGNRIFNNLIVAQATKLIVDEVGNNTIDGLSNLTYTADPGLFVTGADDYHLAEASAAIDAGVASFAGAAAPLTDHDGNARPSGASIDVGAYEYTGGSGGGGGTDTNPPTVMIIFPVPNTTISGDFELLANATDDNAVASVQFYVNGMPYGDLVTAMPFAGTFDSDLFADGAYTIEAVAEDQAGNTSSSDPVTIELQTNTVGAINVPTTRPRIELVGGKLQRLRQSACYDDNGNVIQGCTPTDQWEDLVDFANSTPDKMDVWHWALMYMVTQNESYANTAIANGNSLVACDYSCIRSKDPKFLHFKDVMREIVYTYDWLYDKLTTTERANWANYMAKMLYLAWNDNDIANNIYDTTAFAINNPQQNYYYNYMLGTALIGVALAHEMPTTFTHNGSTYPFFILENGYDDNSQQYTDPLEFWEYELNNSIFPVWELRGEGGAWMEGENYGRAMKRHTAEMFLMMKRATGTNYYNDTRAGFIRDAVQYHLHTLHADNIHYSGGDAAQDPKLKANAFDRHLLLQLADGLEGTVESEYAQHWVENVMPRSQGIAELVPTDFFCYRPELPSRNWDGNQPTQYYAEGNGWVNSRSSWGDNAVSVCFTSTDRVTGHQHHDQNHFTIYRFGGSGGSEDGWLLTDTQPFASTLPQYSNYHNTYLIDGTTQRYKTRTEQIPQYGYIPTGQIAKYQPTAEYTYVVGDASDAYWTDPGTYGHGDNKMTDVFLRELVHSFPGYVVVFDRVSLTNAYSSAAVDALFHYPYSQPSVNGNLITSTTGGSRLFQKVLLPESFNINWLDEDTISSKKMDSWRATMSDNVTRQHYQFLNVFLATSSSVTSMPETQKVASTTGNMVGALIKDSAKDLVFMFSTDPSGTPPAGSIIYDVGGVLDSRHRMFNLVPDAAYDIRVHAFVDGYQVAVERNDSGTYVASSQGVLEFNPLNATPAITAAAGK